MAISWADQHGTTGTLIGDRAACGKGIAGELMRLRADYAFTQHAFGKLKSAYLEGNEASWRAQASAATGRSDGSTVSTSGTDVGSTRS